MRRALLLGVSLSVLLLLAVSLVLAPPPSGPPTPAPAPVQPPPSAEPLAEGTARAPDSFIGVVVPSGSVELTARAEGLLQSVEVQVGDRVKAGQILARLETKSLERELERAEAGLDSARAEESVAALALEEASERLQRSSSPQLVSVGALSEQEQAQARYQERTAAARLEVARAQVRDRLARLEQLRLQLAESVLRAPFDGSVVQRYADPGVTLSTGRPLLHLLRAGPLRVRFAIPESQASLVAPGAPVHVAVQGTPLTLEGRVESVSPEVDTASRMVLAIASLSLEPQQRPVPSGAVVRVSLHSPEAAARP